jgi:hypothetical protein
MDAGCDQFVGRSACSLKELQSGRRGGGQETAGRIRRVEFSFPVLMNRPGLPAAD